MINNVAVCLECGNDFEQERDLQICDDCIDKFDTDELWYDHDTGQINVLDFNESPAIRETYRIK